jgi:hypothetical protein
LLGVSGSGKSIVARRLLAAGFTRLRFADPIRDMLAAGFGCTVHEIDGDQRNEPQRRFGGHNVQTLMHKLSHDWGRHRIHTDIFAIEYQRRCALIDSGYILTDDLQRPNEAAAVRDAGGIIVRIVRPGLEMPTKGARIAFQQQQAIKADLELVNDKGADALAALADRFLTSLDAQLASAA